jgi:hypothetical protein
VSSVLVQRMGVVLPAVRGSVLVQRVAVILLVLGESVPLVQRWAAIFPALD